jgi:hypothetical protein
MPISSTISADGDQFKALPLMFTGRKLLLESMIIHDSDLARTCRKDGADGLAMSRGAKPIPVEVRPANIFQESTSRRIQHVLSQLACPRRLEREMTSVVPFLICFLRDEKSGFQRGVSIRSASSSNTFVCSDAVDMDVPFTDETERLLHDITKYLHWNE